MNIPILTILTLLPLAGAIIVLLTPRLARTFALFVAALSVVYVFALWLQFSPGGGILFEERRSWMPSLGIEYHLGIDGISIPLLALSALVIGFAIVASANATPLFWALLLFVESGLFGVFTALNFFHWFLFWELSLIPAFFLVRFDGTRRQTRAALQFFIYTMTGSVAMLLSFLAFFRFAGTMDFLQLARIGPNVLRSAGPSANWIFAGVLLGLAVKVPLVPFHTWLPETYSEAPTPVSMVLTGALSKMGLYGMLRILLPIFSQQLRAWLTPLICLAVATVVLPAAAAVVQRDLKRMVAYCSINHLGYCLVAIFAVVAGGTAGQVSALNGVVLQMFNHGITAATLFYFVGQIETRAGTRSLDAFGGLRQVAPVFAGLMGIALFASVGLPGLNGFVGEFLIFKGVFALVAWAAVAALPGLFLTALCLLTLWRRVWHGPLPVRWNAWTDLNVPERCSAAAAIMVIFILGLFPGIIVNITNPAIVQLINNLNL